MHLELRRIGEMYYKNVIALAGHLHGIHNEVQVLKARHLSFRKEILNDHTNIFQVNHNTNPTSFFITRPDTAGPNPFSGSSKSTNQLFCFNFPLTVKILY